VTYDWRDPAPYGKDQQIGLIAQDVEKVFPQVVTTHVKTGLKSMAYDHLIAPVIEAIKTLWSEISGLKAENERLKTENLLIRSYLCNKDPLAPFCH
jgi:trimeric autotransporter adhesin